MNDKDKKKLIDRKIQALEYELFETGLAAELEQLSPEDKLDRLRKKADKLRR